MEMVTVPREYLEALEAEYEAGAGLSLVNPDSLANWVRARGKVFDTKGRLPEPIRDVLLSIISLRTQTLRRSATPLASLTAKNSQ